MTRDPRKLDVFISADALALDIYHCTKDFPSTERYGLQAQLRRTAVSVAANIVEGSARRTGPEYVNFLNVAIGSAYETRYLATLAARLQYFDGTVGERLERDYTVLCAQLATMIRTLSLKP